MRPLTTHPSSFPPGPAGGSGGALVVVGASAQENAAAGTVVGALSAPDPDAAGASSFTLLDNAGGRFAINGKQLVVER